jgi:hypothetical protein
LKVGRHQEGWTIYRQAAERLKKWDKQQKGLIKTKEVAERLGNWGKHAAERTDKKKGGRRKVGKVVGQQQKVETVQQAATEGHTVKKG